MKIFFCPANTLTANTQRIMMDHLGRFGEVIMASANASMNATAISESDYSVVSCPGPFVARSGSVMTVGRGVYDTIIKARKNASMASTAVPTVVFMDPSTRLVFHIGKVRIINSGLDYREYANIELVGPGEDMDLAGSTDCSELDKGQTVGGQESVSGGHLLLALSIGLVSLD